MNRYSLSTPKNLIANIVGEKIYLEKMSNQMIETVKGMGAFQMAYRSELIGLIECADEGELIKTLQELNCLGFILSALLQVIRRLICLLFFLKGRI